MGLYAKKTELDPMPYSAPDMEHLLRVMEINTGSLDEFVRSLPFSSEDGTAGVENEFQAAVLGKKEDLDLAQTIEDSNYYKNMVRRAESGDTSRKKIEALNKYLDKYLNQGPDNIWENSWVRFPRRALNSFSNLVFKADLKSDKTRPDSGTRPDADHFTLMKGGEEFVRIPVSYLLKLALADIVGSEESLYSFLRIAGEKMMAHFLNDNTSPEIFSFYPAVANGSGSLGKNIARETLIRFLLTQVLVQYAQKKFLLRDHGQEARLFSSAASACGRLVGGIMETSRKKDPMKLRGELFNQKAEAYFINGLRKKQTVEAFSILQEECEKMDCGAGSGDPALRAALDLILKGRDLPAFLESIRQPCLNDTLALEDIRKLIFLMILYTDRQARHPE